MPPSFATGALISRFGLERTTGAGLALITVSAVIERQGNLESERDNGSTERQMDDEGSNHTHPCWCIGAICRPRTILVSGGAKVP